MGKIMSDRHKDDRVLGVFGQTKDTSSTRKFGNLFPQNVSKQRSIEVEINTEDYSTN